MEYRNGREVTADTLYEQDGLREQLMLPADRRIHYLSFVFPLPPAIRQELTLNALDWTSAWPANLCYVQSPDSLHLTVVEVGTVGDSAFQLHDLLLRAKRFLDENPIPENRFSLTEARIGNSGVNCEVKATPAADDWVQRLGEKLPGTKVKALTERSISLVRYLLPPEREDAKGVIVNALYKLHSLPREESQFHLEVEFSEVMVARLDKVGYYFQVLATLSPR